MLVVFDVITVKSVFMFSIVRSVWKCQIFTYNECFDQSAVLRYLWIFCRFQNYFTLDVVSTELGYDMDASDFPINDN